MKTVLVALAAWLGTLSGGALAQAVAAPSVTGTTWYASKPHAVEYYFAANGTVAYRDGTGIWTAGTWRQRGDSIEVDLNNKFASFRGTIKEAEIAGEFSNIKGQGGLWSATRRLDNDVALVAASAARPIPEAISNEPLSAPSNAGDGFVGMFRGAIAVGSSSLTIEVTCDPKLLCEEVVTNVRDGGKPEVTKTRHEEVRPAARLEQARLSLQYARRNRFDRPSREEFAAIVDKLKPLLESDVDIERCLSLSQDQSSLLCRLVRSPWNEPVLLFLGMDLSPCRQKGGFCGYVIFPAFQAGSTGAGRNR